MLDEEEEDNCCAPTLSNMLSTAYQIPPSPSLRSLIGCQGIGWCNVGQSCCSNHAATIMLQTTAWCICVPSILWSKIRAEMNLLQPALQITTLQDHLNKDSCNVPAQLTTNATNSQTTMRLITMIANLFGRRKICSNCTYRLLCICIFTLFFSLDYRRRKARNNNDTTQKRK